MKKLLLFIAIVSMAFIKPIYSQLIINDINDPQQLAEVLAGHNINVSNASIAGDNQQSGAFTFSGTGLGVSSGVILSSGNIFDAVGPNSNPGTSTAYNGPGHPLLNALSGQQTNDAAVLEFDFEVQSDKIEFNFIFMSEEYNEWVGSSFNDVFAFYISGPGIDGEENLAVVPGTTTPVSINTINNESFWQFYNDNESGSTNIEFDGFTTLMKAEKEGLETCGTYTLKLMVADASDAIFDAAVLLQENSLIQANISATASTYSSNNTALEGCIEANFIFELDEAMDYDTYIPIKIGGSATNGVDYSYIDSVVMIPQGQTSATIILEALTDGIPEGQETVEIYYSPEPCMEYDTAFLYIDDYQPIEFTSHPSDASCNGSNSGEVYFDVTGGTPDYKYFLTDSITGDTATYYSNPVTGLDAGTYLVEILDEYGCDAEDIVFGGVFNTGPTFLPDGTGVSYTTSIEVEGFSPTEVLENIDQLSVCAELEHSFSNDLTIFLKAPNGSQVMLKNVGPTGGTYNACNMGEPVASGPIDEWNSSNTMPGIGYEYCWNSNPTYGTMNDLIAAQDLPYYTYTSTFGNELSDYYLPAGSYTPVGSFESLLGTPINGTWSIIVTDNYALDNGYIFEWNLSVTADMPDSVFTIEEPLLTEVTSNQTNPDCGLNNGAIDLTVSGEAAPYTFLWNNGETTEDVTGLSSGTYTVSVTGTDTCTYEYTFNLSSSGSLALSGSTNPVSCVGENDGGIDLTVGGGNAPFTYNWSNGEITEDISNLAPTNYTVTVTDNSGCTGIESFIVPNATPINISAELAHENCGDSEGSINISVTGGAGNYNFAWSNGLATEDIDELSQGSYTVTVSDDNGCTKIATYTIINYVGNCTPDCDLEITNAILVDEQCGTSNGSIDLTIFTSNSPYSVNWSNGSNSEDITGLTAGNYSITITDAEGCEATKSYTISNETGGLAVSDITTVNESCGDGTGSVDIAVNGGAMPYSYLWSNNHTTQDLDDVHAGEYTVTITDANDCSITASATVENETTGLELSWSNVIDETCGNSNGSIDIQVEGATYYTTYEWSNGASTEDLTNINAGTYTCTITDYYGCSIITPNFVVENQSGSLEITNIDIDNEVCGNAQGEIEITVNGGATPITFNWSNGETTQDIFNLIAGDYSCEITDANGCSTNTGTLTVLNESGTLQLDEVATTDEICNNQQGAIDLTISGGTLPYAYAWDNGSTSEDLNGVAAGNYSCVINDDNGCEITVNSTVQSSQGTLEIVNTIVTDENCGNTDGAINLYINGGTSPISFDWSSGHTTEDITNIAAGLYTCTVTDAQGCEVTTSSNVQNNSGSLSLDNYFLTNEQCGQADGAIDLVVSGTEAPIAYNWSNGATSQDITNLSASTYTCTITDNVGCTLIAGPYMINNSSPSLEVSNIAITDESCGNGQGSIDITITGGTSPFSVNWSNGETTEDISNLSAGTYTYTITDATGCSIYNNVEVGNNSGTLSLDSYDITNEICSNSMGAIDISSSGGVTPHSFIWNSGQTTEDLTNISAGNYIVTITDSDGCQVVSQELKVINDPGYFELVNIAVTDEQCNDNSGTIDVTLSGGMNPISYSWSNGDITQDLNNLPQGVYSCTSIDNNGCVLNYSATVNNIAGDLSVDNIEVTDATCGEANGEVDISVSGGSSPYTFDWSNGLTTEDISNVYGGNYTCLISDQNGCSVYANAQVQDIGGNMEIQIASMMNEICGGSQGAVNINIEGGTAPFDYAWSHGPSTEDVSNLSAGTYTVTVTDDLGCSKELSVTIENTSGDLSLDDSIITDEICGNGEGAIDLTISGTALPITFDWSNGAHTEDLTNLTSGDYSVTITDNYGCSIEETYTVNYVTNGFELVNADVSNEYCMDGSGAIDLTITGGISPYIFEWSNGETTEDISNLTAGTYSCTITDNVGCEIYYETEIINESNGLAVNLVSSDDDYCEGGVGSIDIEITGGEAPYTFTWSNGSTNEDLTNLSEGLYTITITDNAGCKVTDEFEIMNQINEEMGFASMTITNDFCNLGTGKIEFTPTGTGNYTYTLNGVPSSTGNPMFEDLMAGNYTVSIHDYGCQHDTSVVVENEVSFNIIVATTNDVCNNNEGAVDLTINPPSQYNYFWSNGETTQDLTDIPAGSYSCTVTEGSTCQQVITATVENEVTYSVDIQVTDEYCGNADGEINLTLIGSGIFSHEWSNGETTQDIDNLSAGIYTCTITDDNNCVTIIEAEVMNNTGAMEISSSVTNDFCGQGEGAVSLDITGTSDYNVIWSNNESSDEITNLSAGNYSVTVTDNLTSCAYINSFEVLSVGNFNVNAIITEASGQNQSDGAIDLMLFPTGSYTFNWSNGETTEDISNVLPDDYTVEITSNEGCIINRIYTVDYTVTVINNANNDEFFKAYPNPTNGLVYIDYDLLEEKEIVFTLHSSMGGVISEHKIVGEKGKFILDLSNHAPGVYFIQLDNQGKTEIIKIVKHNR